jgi:hypothetical protein
VRCISILQTRKGHHPVCFLGFAIVIGERSKRKESGVMSEKLFRAKMALAFGDTAS